MPREQGEGGEFVETLAPADVLDVFGAVDGPVILSADVANHFGVSRQTARRKLKQLTERGELDRRKVSRRVIYWRPDGDGFDADKLQGDPSTTLSDTDTEDAARAGGAGDGTETPDKETNAESDHTRDESGGLAGLVRDHMEREDLPPKTEHGRNAVIDVFQYLREHETAKTGDIKDHLAPNYVDQYASKKAMWESVYRYLEDIPGVDKAGRGKYAYAGDERVREEVSP